MNLKALFIQRRRLRTGWRILIFFAVSFPGMHILTIILWGQTLVRYTILFWGLLALSMAMARTIDKRPAATVGFHLRSGWLREYTLGLCTAFLLVGALFSVELAAGFTRVEANPLSFSLLKDILIFSLLTTLFQSAFEELLFRGYLYQNLIKGTNIFFATAVLSVLFGVGHLLNPNSNWLVAVNLTVFGVLLAIGYVRTKALWFSAGFHFSWNFFMGKVFSLPVSGRTAISTFLELDRKGPGILTGGDFGPEAGLPAFLVLFVACFFLYRWKGLRPSVEAAHKGQN